MTTSIPGADSLTVSEVSQICELICPLGHNSNSVFEESDHDEKAADGRQVSRTMQSCQLVDPRSDFPALLPRSCIRRDSDRADSSGLQVEVPKRRARYDRDFPEAKDSRFQWLAEGIQPILNLACLFSDLVERTRVVCGIVAALRSKLVVQAQVVACGATYLRHLDAH
jgi:hypothetical protein